MLWLYDEFDTDFDYNGIVLNGAYDANIHRVLNGTYKLTFKLPIADNDIYSLVKVNMVIKADEATRTNIFRVKYIDINDNDKSVTFTCYHIFYDFSKYLVKNFTVLNTSCLSALARWHNSFITPPSNLTYFSNFLESNSFSTVKDEKDNTNKYALDILGEIAKVYNADVDFNGFRVNLLKRIGVDTEEVLTTEKNITEFVDETNVDEIYTRIYATATYKPDVDKDEIKARFDAERSNLKASQKAYYDKLAAEKTEARIQAEIDSKYSSQLAGVSRKTRRTSTVQSYADIERTIRDKYARQEQQSVARKTESSNRVAARKREMDELKARQKEEYQNLTEEITIAITVDSPLINDYPFVNETHLENNECRTVDELYAWAMDKFLIENIDKPKRSIKVSYEQLNENVHLGDTVIVKNLRHNFDERIRIVETNYDPINKRYIKFILGEKTTSFGSQIGSSISSGVSNGAFGYINQTLSEFDLQVKQEQKNFKRVFETDTKAFKEKVEESFEKAKAKAEEKNEELRQQLQSKIEAEATKSQELIDEFKQSFDATKHDLISRITSNHTEISGLETKIYTKIDRDNELLAATMAFYKNAIELKVEGVDNKLKETKQTVTGIDLGLNNIRTSVNTLRAGVFKKSEFRQTDDKITFATGYEIDGRRIGSILSLSPEGTRAVTDKMIITADNENLIPHQFRTRVELRGRQHMFGTKYKQELRANDEFSFDFDSVLENLGGAQGWHIGVRIHYTDSSDDWITSFCGATGGGVVPNHRVKGPVTLKIPADKPNSAKVVEYWEPYVFQNSFSNFATVRIENLKLYKKKSAELIVDGSITADKFNAREIVAGSTFTNMIKSVIGDFDYANIGNATIGNARVTNMSLGELITKKIIANEAFINKLNTINFDFTKATGAYIQSQNGSMKWHLNNNIFDFRKSAKLNFYDSSRIEFHNANNYLYYDNGYSTAFVGFKDSEVNNERHGAVMVMGVSGNRNFDSQPSNGIFSGIRIFNSYVGSRYIDQIDIFADKLFIKGGYNENNGFNFDVLASKLSLDILACKNLNGFGFNTGSIVTSDNNTYDSVGIKKNNAATSLDFTANDDIVYSYNGTYYSLWPAVNKTASDRDLKENFDVPTYNGLDVIKSMVFYSFDWKDKNRPKPRTNIGCLAQELQEIDDSLVYKNGSHLAVDDFRLLNISLKAIQELNEKVEKNEEELSKIKKLFILLKGMIENGK